MKLPAMIDFEIVGARGAIADPSSLLAKLQSVKRGQVLALDADLVCGREHLETAVEHAGRSFQRGTNSANNMMMETMLFASGERQISKAREKMGLKDGTERIALVLFGTRKDEVFSVSGLEEDGSVLECTEAKLSRFGIDPKELRAVPAEKRKDLVLERVAFVEILKR